MFEGKLTQKQRAFAEAIFRGESATDAYVIAGYSCKNRVVAGAEGHRLTKNPQILAYLNYLRSQVEQKVIIDEVKLIQELNAIALSRIDNLIDLTSGQPLPLDELKQDDRLAAVAEFSYDELETERGIRRKRRLKTHDKIKAIETLLKISGYLSEINVGLRIMESYGVKLRQDENNEWYIEK